MALFEIKDKFDGTVLFALETESMRLCVEEALSSSANLSSADLRSADLSSANLNHANLRSADLSSADLRSADLRYANLRAAKIKDGITITKAPIQISGLFWLVTIWDRHMQIGCEFHHHEEWRNFSDDKWLTLGGKEALYLKREQFPALIALCDQHRPKESKTEIQK